MSSENSKSNTPKLSNSIYIKLLVILFLIVLMQIPLFFVDHLINERQGMEYQAQAEISKRWGRKQSFATPVLLIKHEREVKGEIVELFTSFQAQTADIDIQLDAEKRYLGIYESAVYKSKIKMNADIVINPMSTTKQNNSRSLHLFIPIDQLKGVKQIDKISINAKANDSPPQQFLHNNQNGIMVALAHQNFDKRNYHIEVEMTLAGSQQFDITPLAHKTLITMHSNWPSPSFVGDYLPDDRKITSKGFEATWQINQLGFSDNTSNYATNNFTTNNYKSQNQSLGVRVLIPANTYQVNERTIKYSFLIIVLTFASFFLIELIFKIRLHPFQYLLIGFTTSTFYLLLLSFSEYMSFNWAYLVSTTITVGIIANYCSVILQQRKRGLYTGALFFALFGFIYIMVKAEQMSLLMGSIGLVVILALIMYLTRKLDWYEVNIPKSPINRDALCSATDSLKIR